MNNLFIIYIYLSLIAISCNSSSKEYKEVHTFYSNASKNGDLTRLPIIEPFELVNAVLLDENTWHISHSGITDLEEVIMSNGNIQNHPKKYISVIDSTFYIMCPSRIDTSYWIYDYSNGYKYGMVGNNKFQELLTELNYKYPFQWYDIKKTWINFYETKKLPWYELAPPPPDSPNM